MGKYILLVFGILSVLYGILILQVGSGTLFWVIWEVIGAFFLIWAFLIFKEFFVLHKTINIMFHSLVGIGIAVLVIFCSMIAGKFSSTGEPNLDYIIVLGAQVRENGPSVVLRYRLDAAIDYLEENPDTICIVSGGQGANEPFSEAEGMADYLMQHGIKENRILLEDQSTNTVENIKYSKALMQQPYSSVGIVTNNFHMFRAVQIAKAQGLNDICGIAAQSNILYLPNNVLRECCGIFKDWIMKHI